MTNQNTTSTFDDASDRSILRIAHSGFHPDDSISEQALLTSLFGRQFVLTAVARVSDGIAIDERLFADDEQSAFFVSDFDPRSAASGQFFVVQHQEGHRVVRLDGEIVGDYIHPDVASYALMLYEGSDERYRLEPTSWWAVAQVALIRRYEGNWDVSFSSLKRGQRCFATREAASEYAQQEAKAVFVKAACLASERRFLRGEDNCPFNFSGIAEQLLYVEELPATRRPARISSPRQSPLRMDRTGHPCKNRTSTRRNR